MQASLEARQEDHREKRIKQSDHYDDNVEKDVNGGGENAFHL